MTQPGQAKPSVAQAGAATATAAAAQAARPSMMRNLLLGGLMGAGLATLFGAGAFANVLGFLLQGLLIAGLVYLAVAFFRSRRTPAMASATAATQSSNPYQAHLNRQALGTGPGGAASPEIKVTGDDFNAFERLLGEIQTSYGRNDLDTLGRHVTPEMLSYFAQELDDNRKNGIRNVLGAPKLLQGDLSEAWREAGGEYATVAMRYAMTDAMLDASGKVVSGSTSTPDEVTEVWTFRRNPGAGVNGWELSAIQQA